MENISVAQTMNNGHASDAMSSEKPTIAGKPLRRSEASLCQLY